MSILILYGSETGTAQDTAESLSREAEMMHLPARVYGLDEFPISNLSDESVVIFIVSTTGQGEFPPNMRSAWKFLLRKSLNNTFLENVNVAVLGLGDSSYQKYNFAGKKIFRRLIQLGARMMTDLGLADDQHELGIDGALIPWKNNVFQTIYNLQIYSTMHEKMDPRVVIQPKYRFDSNLEDIEDVVEPDYHRLTVIFNNRVTAENHFQETRLVRFQIDNPAEMRYQPGDVLMVRSDNPEETVNIAIEALNLTDETLDKAMSIRTNNKYARAPLYYLVGKITTLRTCLTKYFDLQQIPKRSFFEVLSYLSNDETEKERLAELASPQGLDDFLDYANRCRRTIAETLRDFPATAKNLKPDNFFDLFTLIRPRAFSIASAPSDDIVEIIVAKVQYKARMADVRRGLCSTFISRLKAGDNVFCKVRPGTFKFPAADVPVVCVGPGTGVAPFRSFFGERETNNPNSSGILFFGCRGIEKDFYFSNEWERMSCVEVLTAFSRDSEKKVYVQHKILEFSDKVRNILNKNGRVFVAGSSGDMPKAVTEAINSIVEGWCEKAEVTGKLQFETWS